MHANTTTADADVDLIELARAVERNVPTDVALARQRLRLLSDAVAARREQGSWRRAEDDNTAMLRAVLARVAHDLAGGHVLAVSGLELQVKRYLRRSSAVTIEPSPASATASIS